MSDLSLAPPTSPKRRRSARARRGSGMLYQQLRRDGKVAPTWWSKIYVNGRPVRESTGTTDREAAEGVLRDRLTRASQGLPVVKLQDVRFDELADDLKTHYETTGSRDPHEAEKRIKPLRRFFAGWRAAQIDGAAFNRYVVKRQATGTANSTINRERSVLLKMLRLALEHGKLARSPSSGGSRRPRRDQVSSRRISTRQCGVTCRRTFRPRVTPPTRSAGECSRRFSRSSGATWISRVAVSACARAKRRTTRAARCF